MHYPVLIEAVVGTREGEGRRGWKGGPKRGGLQCGPYWRGRACLRYHRHARQCPIGAFNTTLPRQGPGPALMKSVPPLYPPCKRLNSSRPGVRALNARVSCLPRSSNPSRVVIGQTRRDDFMGPGHGCLDTAREPAGPSHHPGSTIAEGCGFPVYLSAIPYKLVKKTVNLICILVEC
jgi:hypothetical protein